MNSLNGKRRVLATLSLLWLALVASPALAQSRADSADDNPYGRIESARSDRWAEAEPEREREPGVWEHRDGFTLQLAVGLGYQNLTTDSGFRYSQLGITGVNLGVGAFFNPVIGLWWRLSTTITFPRNEVFNAFSVGGTQTVAVQIWPIDMLRLEVGVGHGFHIVDLQERTQTVTSVRNGFGMLLSVAVVFYQRGPSAAHIGVDYAPAFVEDGPLHNLSFVVGWQFL